MRDTGALRRAAAFALLLLALVPGAAHAQYRMRVVLLEQPSGGEAIVEVLARVRGELSAAGFEVVLLPTTTVVDPAELSETAARELHPAAVLLVVEQPAGGIEPRTIELWMSDRLSRRTFVQRLPIDSDDAGRGYARLAVQAVELLKARLAELSVSREPPPPEPPPPEPPARPPPPPQRFDGAWRIGAGVGLLQGFQDLGSSFTPVVRVGASVPVGSIGAQPAALDVGAAVAAFGAGTTLAAPGGEARVEQALGMIEVALRFGPDQLFQPLVSVGAGAYALDVEGKTSAPRQPRSETTWSALTALGAGLWIQPTPGVAFDLEAQLARAWSKTTVLVDEQRVADAGAPLVLLSLSVVGAF